MAGLMSKVAFASKVSILMKTTADDSNPTPGYLYSEVNTSIGYKYSSQEILKCVKYTLNDSTSHNLQVMRNVSEKLGVKEEPEITYESAEYCEHMVEFLLERLKKKSLHVKLKVLLVLRNAVEKGSSDFARTLRKHSEPIKELKTFSGQPDPLLGDSLYVSIRKTSGEVLDVLFDTDQTNITNASSNVTQSTGVAPQMEGFGVSANTEEENSMIGSIFGKIKEAVPTIKNAAASMMTTPETDNKEYKSYGSNRRPVGLPSDTLWGFGTSGGGNDFSSSINPPPTSNSEPMNWLTKKNPDVTIPQPQKYKIDLHENEKRIVEEIAIPQGIRNQPTTQDMYNFCQKCKNLDNSAIMKLLSEKLTNQDSRVQLRTMHIIENLLQSKLPNITVIAKEHCSGHFNTLQSSSLTSVRDKSAKLLQLINKDQYGCTDFVDSGSFAPPPSQQQAGSLLDFNSQQNDVFAGLQVQEIGDPQPDSFDLFGSSNISVQPQPSKPINFGGPSMRPAQTLNSMTGMMNSAPKSNLLDMGLDPFASLSSPSTSVGAPKVTPNNSLSSNQSSIGSTPKEDLFSFGGLNNDTPKKVNPVGTMNYDLNSSLIFNEPIMETKAPQKEAAPVMSFPNNNFANNNKTENISGLTNNFIADFSSMNTKTSTSQPSNISDDIFGNITGYKPVSQQPQQQPCMASISPSPCSPSMPSSSNFSSADIFDGLQMKKSSTSSTSITSKPTPSPTSTNSFPNFSNFSSSSSAKPSSTAGSSSLDSLQPFLTPNPAATPSPSMNSLQKQQSFPSHSNNIQQQSNFNNFNQSNFNQPQQQNMNQTWKQSQQGMGMSRPNTQMPMTNNYQNFNPQMQMQSSQMRGQMNFQQQQRPGMVPNRFTGGQPYGTSPQQYGSPTMYGQSPQNSFSFIAPQRPTKTNNDSFSFVQDAMKASKR